MNTDVRELDPESLRHYISGIEEPCPRCHQPAEFFIEVVKDHYGVCPTDRVAWHIGYNLWTTYWRMKDDLLLVLFGTTDLDLLAAESDRLLREYEMIGDRLGFVDAQLTTNEVYSIPIHRTTQHNLSLADRAAVGHWVADTLALLAERGAGELAVNMPPDGRLDVRADFVSLATEMLQAARVDLFTADYPPLDRMFVDVVDEATAWCFCHGDGDDESDAEEEFDADDDVPGRLASPARGAPRCERPFDRLAGFEN